MHVFYRYFSALVQGKTLPVNRTPDKVVTPNTMDLTPEVLTTMHEKVRGHTHKHTTARHTRMTHACTHTHTHT